MIPVRPDQVHPECAARPCPLCGSSDESRVFAEANIDARGLGEFAFSSRKLPEYMHYRLLSCPVCDLLYASPVPPVRALEPAYREAAYDSAEEADCASRTYGAVLRRFIGRLPDRDGALDIGAGDGAFLERLLDEGFTRVCGVEPSAAPLRAAKAEVRPLLHQGMFDAAEFQSGSLSLVTCFQTLEHLYDPLAMCRSAYGLLKEGGAAFFVCHDRQAVSARLLGARSPIFDIEHLQLFSPRSVRSLLERSGFADIEVGSLRNRYPLHYWMKLLPLPAGLKSGLVGLLKRTGLGHLPISIPAGNMTAIGFKRPGRV